MRVKVDYRSAGRAAYNDFCKKHSIKLSFNEWLEIIYNFNEEFRNYILETGDREKLPFGLGFFAITKKKRKGKYIDQNGEERMNYPVDWKKTKELGKRIYNLNYHTNGFFFGWKWFKKEARFEFSSLWKFKPSRVSSRMIAHYIKANKNSQHLYKQWPK